MGESPPRLDGGSPAILLSEQLARQVSQELLGVWIVRLRIDLPVYLPGVLIANCAVDGLPRSVLPRLLRPERTALWLPGLRRQVVDSRGCFVHIDHVMAGAL